MKKTQFLFLSTLCCYSLFASNDYQVTTATDTDFRTGLNTITQSGGTLTFAPGLSGQTIPLSTTAPLPGLTSTSSAFVINTATGPYITLDSQGGYPIFYLGPNTLTEISNLVLTNAVSQGGQGGSSGNGDGIPTCGGGGGLGAGGGLFIDSGASATLTNISFVGNQAVGGQGGAGEDTGLFQDFGSGGGGGGGALYGVSSSFAMGAGGTSAGGQGGGGYPEVAQSGVGPSVGGTGGGPFGGSGGNNGEAGQSTVSPFSGGGGGGYDSGSGRGGNGGAAGDFGGGGGAGETIDDVGFAVGGTGGFGGGGGGGFAFAQGFPNLLLGRGGAGGFGGGGGASTGPSLFGGGRGGQIGGGGGAGLGGALFVRDDATLTLQYTQPIAGFSANQVTPGTAGGNYTSQAGTALGPDIFLNAGGNLIFVTDAPLTISTVIASDPAILDVDQPLFVQGSNTLTLSGNNTFGGGVTVNQGGQLAIDTDANLGLTARGGTLTLNQGTLQLLGPTFSTERAVILGSGGGTILLGTGATAVFPQEIMGQGALSLTGSGVTQLNAENSYAGGTIISVGVLQIDDFSSLGSGSITLEQAGTLEVTAGLLSTALDFNIGTGGGTLQLDADVALTLSGDIASLGADSLTISGPGTITFSGLSSNLGTTELQDTTLTLSLGGFVGPLDIDANSTLIGSGAVGTLTNDGQIEMQDTDILVVTGNYTQSAGADWTVEIHGAGQSSLMSVSQTANLDGTLVVHPRGQGFAQGTVYTILTAGNPLVTQFSNVILPAVPTLQLVYNNDPSVQLIVPSQSILYGAFVKGYNPHHVLKNLQEISHQPGSDLIHVINAMDGMNSVELTNALNQLHPAPLGAFELLNANTDSLMTSILARHPKESCCVHLNSDCKCSKATVFAQPFGYTYSQDQMGEQFGFYATALGGILGFDYSLTPQFFLGTAVAYSSTHLKWHHGHGDGSMDKWSLSLYGNYIMERFSMEASILGSIDEFTASRHIQFATIDRNAHHQKRGYDCTAHFGLGGDISLVSLFLRPFINFDYLYLYQKGFTEHGAGSLDLTVQGRKANMLRSEVGLSLTKSWKMGRRGCFAPLIFLSGINECYLVKEHYSARFINESPRFPSRTWNHPIYLISPGAELDFTWCKGFSGAVRYSAELDHYVTTQKLDLRLEWAF